MVMTGGSCRFASALPTGCILERETTARKVQGIGVKPEAIFVRVRDHSFIVFSLEAT